MKCNLIFCVILSLSVVYASVSFRTVRSPQWQAPARPYNGTNTWGGPTNNGGTPPQWQAPARPYNGTNTWGGPTNTGGTPPQWQAPARPYNGTNTWGGANTGGVAYRHPIPSYNRTGSFGVPYTTTRVPHHLPGNRPYPSYNLTQQPGLYQPTYNQSRPSISGGYQPNIQQPNPQQPYQSRFDNQYNSTRPTSTSRLYPDLSNRFGSGGGTPNYGNNVPLNPYPSYGGGSALPNTNPTYGAGVLPNTNPTYGNYNATRTNLPTFNPTARYNNTSQFGGQQANQGVNTWGHPNYQAAPNGTGQPLPTYYNPRLYA